MTALMLLAGHAVDSRPLRLEVETLDGRVLWSVPAAIGDRVDLAFTHSSERCRWTQHYEVGGDALLTQRASTFPCLGPGMPATAAHGRLVGRSALGFEVEAAAGAGLVRMINWRAAGITIAHRAQSRAIGDEMADFDVFVLRIR